MLHNESISHQGTMRHFAESSFLFLRRFAFPQNTAIQNSSARSLEIRMERFRQKGRNEGYLGIDLLRDVSISNVPSPAQRSIAIAADFNLGTTEDEQMKFFGSITHPRFLHIRKHTGEAHIDDAYHLWTAEEAKLDAFLTMDKRFYGVVKQKSDLISSPVLVANPKELCRHLGLRPLDIRELAAETNPFA